ncbi:MAG: phenylalanine--tRNA ligase subunit alpha [Candidatus Diapherotrites archaeon]|nr:phenylalanine--tRNA ligase subunit alpha [Candidatus Diapherotrites archaeon]
MELNSAVKALSEIERKVLSELTAHPLSELLLAEKTGLPVDSVRRSCAWLTEKGLASEEKTVQKNWSLSGKGKKTIQEGFPEEKLIQELQKRGGNALLAELSKTPEWRNEINFALGYAIKNAWVTPPGPDGKVELTGVFNARQFAAKQLIQKIAGTGTLQNEEKESPAFKDLQKRGLVEEKETVQRTFTLSPTGQQARTLPEFTSARTFNVRDPAPTLFIGKKQPYIQFLNSVRQKLTQMGFQEMNAPLIVSEFYNFDVLFQPQNHSARTWTDTYRLKFPTHGKLPDPRKVNAVRNAHENGGNSGSTGWQYKWDPEIARRLMPAAHGTAHSARTLVEGPQIPAKYFAIARCFRPDVLDSTHLIEFNQTEGFIIGDHLNFRHLLFTLKEFAEEFAGATQVKFIPDYYPFTEPSVQLSAKHPTLGWIELGGAGMFRPEMRRNLGISQQVLAWGIGIDRLAMFKLGIQDIRYLFSQDLNWLRNTPQVNP